MVPGVLNFTIWRTLNPRESGPKNFKENRGAGRITPIDTSSSRTVPQVLQGHVRPVLRQPERPVHHPAPMRDGVDGVEVVVGQTPRQHVQVTTDPTRAR